LFISLQSELPRLDYLRDFALAFTEEIFHEFQRIQASCNASLRALAGQYAEESIASIPAKLSMSASRKRLLNVPHALIEWSQDLIEFIVATQKQQHEEAMEAARLAEEEKKRL
jgi:hypothetical protein